ncbi:MAG: hypothetical protein PHT94_02155 [Candidatus Nanoarchaeia archaeon]|nr:hypothetical protein [Candidatus Nanoarchaeia archaeon]
MKKKSDQTGEVLIWLLRLILISILAIGIRTFLASNSQYYEFENDLFLRRILFSSDSFMKYNSDFKSQYFYIIETDKVFYEKQVENSFNKIFSSKDDIGIYFEVICEDKSGSYRGYFNEDFYKTRRLFTSNYFRNDYEIQVLCENEKNDYYYFTKGVMKIEILSKFRISQLSYNT